MKWNRAGLVLVLAAMLQTSAPVDACGIKLVIKTSTPRKSVARSSNPSHMLLLGTPPHRLERELSAAGHDVEVAPNAAAAKRSNYAVVIVDSKQADEARTKYAGALVIVRSDDVTADLSSIENQVARQPVAADKERPVLAARATRPVVKAGPIGPTHEQTAAGGGGTSVDTAVTPPPVVTPPPAVTPPPPPPPVVAIKETPKPAPKEQPKPAPVAVNTTEKPRVEQPEPKPVKPAPVAPAAVGFHDEFYFGLSSSAVANNASIGRAVKWLNASPDLHVTVEGYADPTGDPAQNMALGQSRAESVRDALVGAGIDTSRIEVTSFGDTKLKYGRTDGRNRRVAIVPKP